MNILALDTSTEYLSLAILRGEALFTRDIHAVQSHSKLVLPEIQAILAEAQLQLSDIEGIAFGAGPGSFTGLRIACGVAQGLAYGIQVPVVPVGTLHALAEQSEADRVIACIDARMGEVYHATYIKDHTQPLGAQWVEQHAPSLSKPDALPVVDGSGWCGIGSGWKAYADVLKEYYNTNLAELKADVEPSAATIARIARPIFEAGEGLPAHLAAPLYVRNKVALTTQERTAP